MKVKRRFFSRDFDFFPRQQQLVSFLRRASYSRHRSALCPKLHSVMVLSASSTRTIHGAQTTLRLQPLIYAGIVLSVITCVVCIVLTETGDHTPEENTLPYISDGGGIDPERVIFAAGLGFVGFFIMLYVLSTDALLHRQLHALPSTSADPESGDSANVLEATKQVQAATAYKSKARFAGIIAAPCLVLLSATSAQAELTVHVLFALTFFTGYVRWSYCVNRVQWIVSHEKLTGQPLPDARRKQLVFRSACVAVMIVSLFLIVLIVMIDRTQTVVIPIWEYILFVGQTLFTLSMASDFEHDVIVFLSPSAPAAASQELSQHVES